MTLTKDLAVSRDLMELWPTLKSSERKKHFFSLPRHVAEELFLNLTPSDQVDLLNDRSDYEIRSWLRFLPPDDAADFIQRWPMERRQSTLMLLDEKIRHEITGLLAYAEDAAGGLMNPEYIRL